MKNCENVQMFCFAAARKCSSSHLESCLYKFLLERLWENLLQISKLSGNRCNFLSGEYEIPLRWFVFRFHADLIRKTRALPTGSHTDK